jgi:hypothetical protein
MPPLDPLQDYRMPYGGRLAVSQQRLIRLVYFVTLYCLTPYGPKKKKKIHTTSLDKKLTHHVTTKD